MKGFGLWVLLLLFGTALICVFLPPPNGSNIKKTMEISKPSRKLKENNNIHDGRNIDLDDYLPTDPVPSSKASIRPGPIQHGTPLMPYIPKPAPPNPNDPMYVGFP